MKLEIGSEFIIENLPSDFQKVDLPAWLSNFGDIVLTSSGRGALSLILEQISLKSKKALLPAYICESVILPFENAGYKIEFYNLDRFFNIIDLDKIEKFDEGVFLHMGYFGRFTNSTLVNIIRELKNKPVCIVEDVTHTLFSKRDVIFENDFVFGSIRKWFGTPGGGFLASDQLDISNLNETPRDFLKSRILSFKLKSEYLRTGNYNLKFDYLKGFGEAEELLDLDSKAYKIDWISEFIIKTTNDENLKIKRQTNYTFLANELSNVNGLIVQSKELIKSECPLFLTILINENRDIFRKKLNDKNIYCPIHWPLPKQVLKTLSVETKYLYDHILSIPCDQRYDIKDMHQILVEIMNSI